MEPIEISTGFTSITAQPTEIQQPRPADGARVTLEFARTAPLPPGHEVNVSFDIEETGRFRQFTGVPQLTHTTTPTPLAPVYHYRISHWLCGQQLMRFAPNQPRDVYRSESELAFPS